MLKVLWLCNTMLPDLFDRFGVRNEKEGWLIGISNELRKQNDIEFHFTCMQTKENRIVNIKKDKIYYHCFYARYDDLYTVKYEVRKQIKSIIDEVCPDVIHVFGTEMPHTIACVDSVENKEKIVISIQGIVSEYAKYYLNGIPRKAYLTGGFVDGELQTIISQYKEFCKRSENEIKAIKSVSHVIGRTDWDRACVKKINSKCSYHFCSETLRDSFYGKRWDINSVERNSIFVCQGDYPIKGLHNLLEALPAVVRKCPNTKVYVAGWDGFIKKGLPYGKYIKNMIRKKGLDRHIFFIGMIGEEQVCEYLLKAHVTIMPSNIENSPNSIGEAMLIGTPVIASFTGGIPSILNHGTEGLLYQHDSKVMLSYYIDKVFRDDSFAQYLSLNSRKRAEVSYDKKNNLQQLLNIYHKINNSERRKQCWSI